MRPIAKAGVGTGGYASAILIAFAVVAVYGRLTDGPHRHASGGMFAFGDSLLFLAVFGAIAVIPTCATLYFLRPRIECPASPCGLRAASRWG